LVPAQPVSWSTRRAGDACGLLPDEPPEPMQHFQKKVDGTVKVVLRP
jgi:hypothetical protein